jgi:hypothetical protein
MPTGMPRVRAVASRVAAGKTWLPLALALAATAVAVAIALGWQSGISERTERTKAADVEARGRLDRAATRLGMLAADVAELGRDGRAALAATVGMDSSALHAALDAGAGVLARIAGESGRLRGEVEALPTAVPSGANLVAGATFEARRAAALDALGASADLARSWAVLAAGCLEADRLADLLRSHDELAGEAARLGSEARYGDALARLDLAGRALAGATALRDRIATVADVSVLASWLSRNAAIDAALRRLYSVMATTSGRMDQEASRALADVSDARRLLPPDARALVVVMADLTHGGPDQAIVLIDEARSRLAAAAADLREPPGG